jgi:hypothetical protein
MPNEPARASEKSPALISKPVELSRLWTDRRNPVRPGTRFVFSDSGGNLVAPSGNLSRLEAYSMRFRYEVDVSEHYDHSQEELPNSELSNFTVNASFTWHVHDPVEVVRRNTQDGFNVVRTHLTSRLQQIARKYRLAQWASAENEINTAFSRTYLLPEGITVSNFNAILTLSENNQDLLEARTSQSQSLDIEHILRVTSFPGGGEIGLIKEYLMKGRKDSAAIINEALLEQSDDVQVETYALFNMLLSRNLITAAELDALLLRADYKVGNANVPTIHFTNPESAPRAITASTAKSDLRSSAPDEEHGLLDGFPQAPAPHTDDGLPNEPADELGENPIDPIAVPVTIYISDAAAHGDVESAVEFMLEAAGISIEEREEPVYGSWRRKISAFAQKIGDSPVGAEAARTAAHALEANLVLQKDADITAALLQNLGPVLTAIQPLDEAVIRTGALLIVKLGSTVVVHQLTATQQLVLDHQPELAYAPRKILDALGVSTMGPTTPQANGVPHSGATKIATESASLVTPQN